MRHIRAIMITLTAATGLLVIAGQAAAIPAFTRLNRTECSTCHTIFPQLTEFGDAFLKNGYVWPREKENTTPNVQQKGDEAILLSGIPAVLPISLTGTLNAAYDDHAHDKLDLSTRALVLQAGGNFREKVGFFSSYTLYSEGRFSGTALTPANNTPDLRELFLVARSPFGIPLNVKAGRFTPKLSLWKGTNRPTISTMAPLVFRPQGTVFFTDAPEDGIEVNRIVADRVFLAAGVVDRGAFGSNDSVSGKEGYGHVSFRIGGADFIGKEPQVDLDADSVWDYLSVTIGGYGYGGRNGTGLARAATRNNFYRVGGDLDVSYQRFRFRGGVVMGRDSNPAFSSSGTGMHSLAAAAEGEYLLGSPIDLIVVFRYEFMDDGTTVARRYVPALTYAALQNVKVSLEYQLEDTGARMRRTALAAAVFSF